MATSRLARELARTCVRARDAAGMELNALRSRVRELEAEQHASANANVEAEAHALATQLAQEQGILVDIQRELGTYRDEELTLERQATAVAQRLENACRALASRLPTAAMAAAHEWARWVARRHEALHVPHEPSVDPMARLSSRGMSEEADRLVGAVSDALAATRRKEADTEEPRRALAETAARTAQVESEVETLEAELQSYAGSENRLRIVADLPYPEAGATLVHLDQMDAVLRSFESTLAKYAVSAASEALMLDRLS